MNLTEQVSDSHSGNHVLLGRIPPLFVHALLSDPLLGEDAFPTYHLDGDRRKISFAIRDSETTWIDHTKIGHIYIYKVCSDFHRL
jgi:hypothetical protein